MSYSHRIWIYGPVGLLLLVVILYSVFWRVQADMLAARLDSANGGEILPGIVFSFAEKSVGGFPFRLDGVLEGVTFTDRRPDGETSWRTERMAFHKLTYRNDLYVLEVAGLQSFELPGGPGQPSRVTHITPGIARASAILREGRLTRFDLDLQNVDAKDARAAPEENRTFRAGRLQFHLLGRDNDTIDTAFKVENATIGEGYKPKLSGTLALADLRGRVLQAASFELLERGGGSLTDALEHWRQNGGMLAVERLTLDWAGMKTDLNGSLGVDGAHRLEGTLTGAVDAGAVLGSLVGALTGGQVKLDAADARLPVSLTFRNGDIQAGLNLGLGGSGR
jgi:hypothetical protein